MADSNVEDDLANEISTTVGRILWGRFFKIVGASEAPDSLYHYTTLEGAIGVLESKKLWASHLQFMNDSKEFDLGADIINSAFMSKGYLDTQWQEETPVFMRLAHSWVNLPPLGQIFASCFCQNGDLLGQWRGYADNGGGVSIGIKSKSLESIGIARLTKVIYSPKHQKEVMAEMVDAYASVYGANYFKSSNLDDLRSALALKFVYLFEYLAPMMKHEAFSEEDEFRLISGDIFENIKDMMKFRVRSGKIIPYMELPFDEFGDSIAEIVIGPSPHQSLTAQAIQMVLERFGYCGVNVVLSSIPYRS